MQPLERSAAWTIKLPLPVVLLLSAAFLRLLAFGAFYLGSVVAGHHGLVDPYDSVTFDKWAWYAAQHFRSGAWVDLRVQHLEGSWDVGFTYLVAFEYVVVGHHPEVARIVNCLIAAFTAPAAYIAARQTTLGENVSRRAGWLVACWPLSIYWAGYDLLKDPLVWFFLAIGLIALTRRGAVRQALLGAAAAGGAYLVRSYMGPVIAMMVAVSAALKRDVPALIAVAATLIVVEAVALATGFPPAWSALTGTTTAANGSSAASGTSDLAGCAGFSGSATCSQSVFTPKGFALRLAVGVPTVLLGPGLKPLKDLSHPVLDWGMYPGLLVWIGLLPFALLGLVRTLRRRDASLWAVALFGLVTWAALALIYAGQATRQREMAFPATLIITSLGLERPWPRAWWPAYAGFWVAVLAGLAWEAGLL